jgi:hypothetical protein
MAVTRKDAEGWVSAVGNKLDLEITANTVPSTSQVQQWLDDGLLRMLKALPLTMVQHFVSSEDLAQTAIPNDIAYEWELSGEYLKFTGVHSTESNVPVLFVSPLEFAMVKAMVPGYSNHAQAWATVEAVDGSEKLCVWPKLRHPYKVLGIGMPAQASTWGPSVDMSPPIEWEEPLIEYAVAQARLQDEEPSMGQLSMQAWGAAIKEMAETGTFGMTKVTP